jgi:hypothetical protein
MVRRRDLPCVSSVKVIVHRAIRSWYVANFDGKKKKSDQEVKKRQRKGIDGKMILMQPDAEFEIRWATRPVRPSPDHQSLRRF